MWGDLVSEIEGGDEGGASYRRSQLTGFASAQQATARPLVHERPTVGVSHSSRRRWSTRTGAGPSSVFVLGSVGLVLPAHLQT